MLERCPELHQSRLAGRTQGGRGRAYAGRKGEARKGNQTHPNPEKQSHAIRIFHQQVAILPPYFYAQNLPDQLALSVVSERMLLLFYVCCVLNSSCSKKITAQAAATLNVWCRAFIDSEAPVPHTSPEGRGAEPYFFVMPDEAEDLSVGFEAQTAIGIVIRGSLCKGRCLRCHQPQLPLQNQDVTTFAEMYTAGS